jgi:hypothetical protein
VKKIWGISNSADSNWFRKMERTLFFTLEFAFKAGYANLIEWAAKASYEEPVTDIFLLVSTVDSLQSYQNVKVVQQERDKKIIGIKRWGAFTKTILSIAGKKIDILEIGGNDEILVSVLVEGNKESNLAHYELLYESLVVSNRKLIRKVYLIPVPKLLTFVKDSKQRGIEVEHIFDY